LPAADVRGWKPVIVQSWWSLLSYTALIVYVALAAVAIRRGPRSLLNWCCALFQFALAFWALEDVFHGNPELPAQYVGLVSDIGTVGRTTIPSFFLVFTLVLTGHRNTLRRWWSRLALIGIPLVFALGLWTGAFPAVAHQNSFGWTVVWPDSPWSYAYYAYLISFFVTAFVLLGVARRRETTPDGRSRLDLILGSSAAAVTLAFLFDIVLVSRPGSSPELGSSVAMIWAVGLTLSMTRFGLMRVTPESAAKDTFSAIADAVLLLTPDGAASSANPAFVELTGRSIDEVVGAPVARLFTRPELAAEELTETWASDRRRSFGLECRTRDGGAVPVSVTAQAIRADGELVGAVWVLHDLSGRLRRERARRASEESYRTFVENFAGIAFEGGLDFSFSFLRGKVRDVTGYDPADFQGGRVRWRDLIHPDDIERLRIGTEQLRTVPGCSMVREYRITRRDGSLAWVQERLWNVVGPDRRPSRLHGTVTDVTEQHRAHEEFAELSQFRASVIDSVSVLMAVIDRQMKVLIWNKAAERITGYGRDEVVGSADFWRRIFPDAPEREHLMNAGRPAMERGEALSDIDAPITRRDGSRRDVRWTFQPVMADPGRLSSFIMLGEDVTELRRAQAEQNRHLHSLAMLSQTSLELIDLAADIDVHAFIAEQLRRLTGAAAVFLSTTDSTAGTLTLRATAGLDDRIVAVVGRRPEDLVMRLPNDARARLREGRLLSLPGGLGELALGALPDIACRAIEQLYDMGKAHSAGIVWQGELSGSVSLVMPAGHELEDTDAVEAFIRQAAIALRRHEAERSLRESELRYRTLIENATDGIAIIQDGKVIYANPRLCVLAGRAQSDVIGRAFTDFMTEESRRDVVDHYRRRMSGERVPTTYQAVLDLGKDRVVNVEISATIIEIEGRPADMAIIRDVTERLHHEAELHEARALYERLASTLPYSVTVVNLEGRIIWASQMTGERFGAGSPARMFGMAVADLVVPEERDRARRWFADVAAGTDMRDARFWIVRPDGTRYPTLVSATLVRDAQGKPMSVLAAVRPAEAEPA
jgi:PAS domain S-box-containing protein